MKATIFLPLFLLLVTSCSKQSHCDISNENETGTLHIRVINQTSYNFDNAWVEEVEIACLPKHSKTRYFKAHSKLTYGASIGAMINEVSYHSGMYCTVGEPMTNTGKYTYTITGIRENNQTLIVQQTED